MTISELRREAPTNDLFGNYKAEWLGERIFDLFRKPTYFPDLERPRPCVLIGGRGTGKTTVLRTLSFEGRYALRRSDEAIVAWPYYGFYYRVNTNRVTAFQGADLSASMWQKLFAHYINLVLSQQVTRFLTWFTGNCPSVALLSERDYLDVSRALHVPASPNLPLLKQSIDASLSSFEACLNNIRSIGDLPLSLQGAPLDLLFSKLKKCEVFRGKHFFFLIDEYENFLDDQQVVINTLLKHASDDYTFKIGVRELGWRKRYTLSSTEELNSPADYVRVDIAESLSGAHFRDFARAVCDARLGHMLQDSVPASASIEQLLPSLTAEEEADLLGVDTKVRRIRKQLQIDQDPQIVRAAGELSGLELYLIEKRCEQQNITPAAAIRERRSDKVRWQNYYDNYKYSYLFTIADSAAQIRKYYSGWNVFTALSSSNIRYLLELVDTALKENDSDGGGLDRPVSPRVQTIAAQSVGKKNLFELEGYREGAQLVKLVLGLGRVFGVLASEPDGHAPEQNQFCMRDTARITPEISRILVNSVMHSALVRTLSNKLDKLDPRSYDYTIHPIFSAFFTFSHRRKRKITLSPEDLLGLVADPGKATRSILRKQGRGRKSPLPGQLRLFRGQLGEFA
jgi:hypothetical protein